MFLQGWSCAARSGGHLEWPFCNTYTNIVISRCLGDAVVEALARPFSIGERTITISGSLGIAALEGPDDTLASMLERADKTLYRTKGSGRNKLRTWVRVKSHQA